MNWLETRIPRIISLTVLFFFSWTFAGVFDIAYAVKNSSGFKVQSSGLKRQNRQRPAERLSKTIDDIKQILDDPVANTCAKNDRLKEKKSEIEEIDKEIKKQFAETEGKLKQAGLPQKILKRHYDFVKKYEDNLKELKKNIQAIQQAITVKGEKEAIEKAKEHLEKINPPGKQKPLDPNKLPHRTAEPVFKEPRLKYSKQKTVVSRQEIESSRQEKTDNPLHFTPDASRTLLASNGSLSGLLTRNPQPATRNLNFPNSELRTQNFVLALADSPTSDDLAETIEVQFTPAITAKAAELENKPVKLYNWVRNNIEFVPTYGSIQGADMCLQTKQCNAFDTASLLIALLRVSNIPAKYVYGTVEIPIEKVKNWVGGFTDPNAALKLIASGGIPVTAMSSGGSIVVARMEHVWVKAYVDYIPYRGAVEGPGDTWIPLDASFKQYNYVDGLDADSALPTDFEALLAEVESRSTINNDIPSITDIPSTTIQNQVSDFQTRLNEYLTANLPEVDTYHELRNTLHGYREIIQKELRFLPNTLAGVKVIAKLDTFSEIPKSLRHTISFNVQPTLDNNPLLYSASLPELAGKRITLSYAPAAPDDAQIMEDAESILGFPLYLVEVIPELKIEGRTVATGGRTGMGQQQNFQMTFSNPHGVTDRVSNTVHAGEYYAVGLDINRVTFQYLYDRANRWQPDTAGNRDDRLGELLYLTSMFYFAKSDYFAKELGESGGIVNLRHPSECLVGMKFSPSYLFGTPVTISSVKLNMDVDRDVISAASKTDDSDTIFSFVVQAGLYSSGLEHSLFESLMGFEAISAIKFLDLASRQSIPIYIIDSENVHRVDELNISSAGKQNIRNFINAGKTVLVPQTEIQYVDYSGIGFAAIDMQTGAGSYMISGSYNGGDTVKENVDALLKLAKDLLGKRGLLIYKIYKNTIDYLLSEYPDIADKPNEKFKEWTERVLFVGKAAKRIPWLSVRVIIGQMILYYAKIMVLDITDPL